MAERFEIVEKALIQMLEDKKYATLRDILTTMNPSDIAGLFIDLEEKKIPLLFRLLPKELASETFVEMESCICNFSCCFRIKNTKVCTNIPMCFCFK